jgi:hypothetical protein
MDIAARVLGVDRGGVDREIDARGGWVVRVDGHGAVIPASARDLQPLHKGEPLADDESARERSGTIRQVAAGAPLCVVLGRCR